MDRHIDIVYYSGTGGTMRVAKQFKDSFTKFNQKVSLYNLTNINKTLVNRGNILVLLFPVHAGNAPLPIIEWLKKLDYTYRKAVVICISGGGEIPPNTASRIASIELLKKKGTDVSYEYNIIMPSNMFVKTPDLVALKLLEIMPVKVNKIAEDIIRGKRNRMKALWIDEILASFLKIEHTGAKILGHKMIVDESCDSCGWCAKECSNNNIKMDNSIPEFGHNCSLCLKCLYGCPSKSISLSSFNSTTIKEGYDLRKLEAQLPLKQKVDVNKEAPGLVWLGLRRYLEE